MKKGLLPAMAAGAIMTIFTFGSSTARADSTIWIDDIRNNIGTVDADTGASTVVGNANLAEGRTLTDIAFDPSGNLWAVTLNSLYTINTSTGAATLVGSFGDYGIMGLVFGTNGTLYGSSGGHEGDLYSINTTTGAATLIGSPGVTSPSSALLHSAGDLAFNDGTLYEAMTDGTNSYLVSIDPTTGAGSYIGEMTSDVYVSGLAEGDDGTLYAVDGTNIFTVNTSTGALTVDSNYGGNGLLAAMGAAASNESVPEPASMTMLGVSVVGLRAIRRRRRD